MHRRVFLYSIVLLLCFVFSVTHAQAPGDEEDDGLYDSQTTIVTPTANSSATSTTASSNASTTKPYVPYGSRYGYNKTRKGSTGGYYGDSYELVGDDGKDPSEDGTDVGDFGPVYGRRPLLDLLDIWITATDDWEQKGSAYKNKPQGSYNKKNYNNKNYKDKNYNDKNYKDKNYNDKNYVDKNYKNNNYKGSRNKRSYKKVSFPVKRFKNYRKFPTNRFPPLISILPWVPIFYDRRTYQTIIFSPTGGIFIIPPLINFYGERFAVAQLIKWGYASLVSSGAPVGPGVDVAPLVHPPPAGGVVAGGAVAGGGGVVFDSSKSQFVGGVQTKFKKFKPRYPQTLEEGGDYDSSGNSSPGSSKPNYGSNLDYGGTRDQNVYPQGGPPKYGGY